MKIKSVILIIFMILAVVGGWVFLKNQQSSLSNHSTHQDLYYCPMHPTYTSDRPGTCPICGMNLVKKEPVDQAAPVDAHESHGKNHVPGYAPVSINSQKQQWIGVKIAPVGKKNLVKTIRAYGYVAHDLELYQAELEYIEAWQVYFAFLARRPVIDQYRADWREYYKKAPAESRWRSDQKRKAMQRLVQAEYELIHMGLTEAQLQQLREVKYGQPWVEPELLFFEENQPFWIYAQILENDLGFVDVGQKAVITIPVYGETTVGVVESVAPFIDPDTRTSRVRIELPSYRTRLSVNMQVNVDMPVELNESLVVPRQSVMDTGLQKIVFVQTQEGRFEPRNIQTGSEADGVVAVKSGLQEGEMIVVSGNFLLDSESRLQASLSGGHNHD
ncbi:MAG: efflux RND transporter periplasmic adaptor subunit [Candidatus Omnitrophica bacterium]|nr:efflux RND transporter periplasmic adaptor subunit [Candidatus Omnitrophota bacterium]